MRTARRIFNWWLLPLYLCALLVSGCADGPLNGGGTMNPWLRKEWDRDERRGPTFHTKMQQLRETAANAASLPPERQQQLASEMTERYRTEENSLLRGAIVKALGQLRSANVEDVLSLAVKDDDTEVRLAAVKALGDRGDEQSLRTLASAMSNESNLDVRIAAATALGKFKNSPDATRALALALDDNDAALQYRAIQSLEQVTGRNYGVNVGAWREYLAGGNPTTPTPSVADRMKAWSWW
jgi:HEAT repeats